MEWCRPGAFCPVRVRANDRTNWKENRVKQCYVGLSCLRIHS